MTDSPSLDGSQDLPVSPGAAEDLLAIGLRPEARDIRDRSILIESGEGAVVFDVHGKDYVDLCMGHGALLLGHGDPRIDAAIREQLGRIVAPPVPHRLEAEVAERLTHLIPGCEHVAFGKNGSDVCAASVRIARAVSGREGVLHFGYHGFHDWCAVQNPSAEGVPESLRELIHGIPYGDLEMVEAIFRSYPDRIAAIIVEPFRTQAPDPSFLRGLRELTSSHGALLIFDEVVTGFRIDRGGAQARFGVTADLVCLGKALGHGMPLAALCGSRDLVSVAKRTAYGMTTRCETLSLAVARAVLDVYRDVDVCGPIEETGRALVDGLRACWRANGLSLELAGAPSMTLMTGPEPQRSEFLRACHLEGIITAGALLPSTRHVEVLDETLERFRRAAERVAGQGM